MTNAYIGVNGVARKIKAIYVGVNGVARKVKKGFIGIANVARQFFSSGIQQAGTTYLSLARGYLSAASIGDYALFGGGYSGTQLTLVDAYNSSLVRSSPTPLNNGLQDAAATANEEYALFGGGYSSQSGVTAYNKFLTRTIPQSLGAGGHNLEATRIGVYALFGGGYRNGTFSNLVDRYDATLTHTLGYLSLGRTELGAASNKIYALFVGGVTTTTDSNGNIKRTEHATVDAFSATLERITPTGLSSARDRCVGASTDKYAFVSGAPVNAYDETLTRQTLPTSVYSAEAATTLGEYALFGTGSYIVAYDSDLTRHDPISLSVARESFAAATVGEYALFGGGYAGANGYSAAVDICAA